MWILTPLQPGGETHYLLTSKEYVVGRKNCDILLPNDQSISRAHAHLTATEQTLTLTDTSKYGTFVNSQRLTENTPVSLKSGDNLTFGVFDSKFSVDHQQLVVCSSCLDADGKASLSRALVTLGGKLVNTWSQECTHLTMLSAKVTIKTISALLCCRPIVKPEFFSELSKAAQQKLPPPKANSFIPEIDEPSLSKEDVNLDVVPHRKQLFSGLTFIFLSAKQLKRLSLAVSFGGGRSRVLEEGSVPTELLESPQSCVVDVTTGSSQVVLPSSTVEWTKSLKDIVERKGLRVITESEIGLAAIYASCDHYCNPSSLTSPSELAPKMNTRIPSASLSQSVAVDETVLPAASQNISAYAANTEPSQEYQQIAQTGRSKVTGVMAVGETPGKKQNSSASQIHGCKPAGQKKAGQSVVAGTLSSSFNTVENPDAQRKKPECKLTGAGSSGNRPQLSVPTTSDVTKTFLPKKSPQKQKISAQASPNKQSSVTSFFQPVTKKRPLEDEFLAVVSVPKRPTPDSSRRMQTATTTVTSKETHRVPEVISQTPPESAADLFARRSAVQTNRIQEEPQSKKRKEMEADMQMDELELIMSEDMDCFEEPASDHQAQQPQPVIHSSTSKKQGSNTVQASSTSKRQRIHLEDNGTTKNGTKNHSEPPEQRIVSIKTEQTPPLENWTARHESSKPPEGSCTSTSKKTKPFGDDKEAFIVDIQLLNVDSCLPEEGSKPMMPVKIKQEAQESKTEDNLPKKLLLVEFRSLTVTAPLKVKPQKDADYAKNFKCFRKIHVPGANGSAHVIRGSDLLVHSRGKNSDLDEWLKDAAEEERQAKQDESVGDDLFRYNPTKLSKRR